MTKKVSYTFYLFFYFFLKFNYFIVVQLPLSASAFTPESSEEGFCFGGLHTKPSDYENIFPVL